MLETTQNLPGQGLFVQGSPGYEKMLSLGSAYIAGKVTLALQATANLSVKSKDRVDSLNVDQVLLLSLLHGLMKKDTAAAFIFTEIAQKLESINSPSLKDWVNEEYFFNYDDVRKALRFAAELAKGGLVFPEIVLSLLENLYSIYCSQKRNSLTDVTSVTLLKDSYLSKLDSSPEKEESSVDEETTSSSTDETPVKDTMPEKDDNVTKPVSEEKVPDNNENTTPVIPERRTAEKDKPPPRPRPRRLDDPANYKHTPMVLPNRVLGEYSQCEQFAIQREQQISPKVLNSPLTPMMKELKTPPINETLKRLSGEFLFKEISSGSSSNELKNLRMEAEAITGVASEADAINEKTGDTALHLAVSKGNVEAVLTLIRRGAIINARNKANVTPIEIAVEREMHPIIKVLLAAGADINQKSSKGEALLHVAAASSKLPTIELLIELGAELDVPDMREQTPIFRAAKKGRMDVMKRLEEEGADIYKKDTFGRSLLHYASWHGQVDAVKWLLKHNLDINATTKHGWTPLHWAVANSQIGVSFVLLDNRADPNVRDSARRTPLFWATEVGNIGLIDLIKSFGGTM